MKELSHVFLGRNELNVSMATMHSIVAEWLHNYADGGPYKIVDVAQCGGVKEARTFRIAFEPVEKEKT